MNPTVVRTVIDSPIGPLTLESNGRALTMIRFDGEDLGRPAPVPVGEPDAILAVTIQQLSEYFEGGRTDFELPLEPSGSPFQLQVWAELCRIGYGETISYGELALRIGRTQAASRAVGLANGANPIPVVVPCHRVIGANGTLVGYGGGLDRKKVLLRLEAEHAVTAQDRLL
ncbi:methylated-DNA--[protein]-cysteine S-methyltransferase [Microlunatus sp. GCM10028923]|uniref:methylated-DNA--[protein]-cysteine S-methyltransferase n=1 Tax=Microlunatus sp. GCM10028923 TaxID=3273400 RepID=UPI0036189807